MNKSDIPDRYRYLASKWKNRSITPEEAKEFADWYNGDQDKEILLPEQFAKGLSDLEESMLKVILSKVHPAKRVTLWPRMAGIAAAVAFIAFGVYFFNFKGDKLGNEAPAYANDIAPGKMGATLTLASGKKIRLTSAANGEVAKEAGVIITKSADGQLVYELKGAANEPDKINTLATANGETYQLRLPDGSMVFLNAASSLTYSTSLIASGKRRVTLRGEAYFQVAKDKTHPFIVKTNKQEIEVLGTHFNVDSYGDDLVEKTTLLEGSVRISSATSHTILKPGEQGRLEDGAINVAEVDTDLAIAWKNGLFVFDDEPLQSVMRRVARWYNVEVTYEGVDQNELYGGSVSRYDHVSKVLRKLELTGGIHFKIEGRNITVMK